MPVDVFWPPILETRASNLVETKIAGAGTINVIIWPLGDGQRGQSYFCLFGSQVLIFELLRT